MLCCPKISPWSIPMVTATGSPLPPTCAPPPQPPPTLVQENQTSAGWPPRKVSPGLKQGKAKVGPAQSQRRRLGPGQGCPLVSPAPSQGLGVPGAGWVRPCGPRKVFPRGRPGPAKQASSSCQLSLPSPARDLGGPAVLPRAEAGLVRLFGPKSVRPPSPAPSSSPLSSEETSVLSLNPCVHPLFLPGARDRERSLRTPVGTSKPLT